MSRTPGASRFMLPWMALVALLSGCQSVPTDVPISSRSSLLAVDVRYPIPLSRDPSLVRVFFVRGPIHGELEELPELIPASFVKWSRAYLLDPEPGTYSLVAVTSAVAPPLNDYPIAGVTKTRWSGTIADAVIFPAELIHRTRTTIGPGNVEFVGILRVRQGDRINANAVLQDDLQRRIAERIRPGATSKSGLAGWFTRVWTVDLEETSLSNEARDRESFFDAAVTDLGDSPWARVVARAAPREATAARSGAPAPGPKTAAAKPHSAAPAPRAAPFEPETVPSEPKAVPPEAKAVPSETKAAPPEPEGAFPEPEAAFSEPEAVPSEPKAAPPELAVAPPEPEAAFPEPKAAPPEPGAPPPSPKRRRVPGLPPGSPLAEIELGMSHDEVRRILGAPDDRIDRLTAKAWIPFYTGPGAYLRDWIYEGEGRVVFSLHDGSLEVLDVVYDPDAGK